MVALLRKAVAWVTFPLTVLVALAALVLTILVNAAVRVPRFLLEVVDEEVQFWRALLTDGYRLRRPFKWWNNLYRGLAAEDK